MARNRFRTRRSWTGRFEPSASPKSIQWALTSMKRTRMPNAFSVGTFFEDDGEEVAQASFIVDDEEVHGGRLPLTRPAAPPHGYDVDVPRIRLTNVVRCLCPRHFTVRTRQ